MNPPRFLARLGLAAAAVLSAALLADARRATAALPPDEISFPARNGAVNFTHRNHFAKHVEGCRVCHAPQGVYSRQLPHVYGKDAAHGFCLGCHQRREKGPTRCSQCHEPSRGTAPALEPPGPAEQASGDAAWPPRLEPIQPRHEHPPASASTAAVPGASAAPSPAPGPANAAPQQGGVPAAEPPPAAASADVAAPAPGREPPSSAAARAGGSPPATPPAVAAPAPAPRRSPPPPPVVGRLPTPAEAEQRLIWEIEEAEARAAEEGDGASPSTGGGR